MSEPHTSTSKVKFCLYGKYVGTYIVANTAGSVSHLYRVPLLPPCAPVGPHLPSFIDRPAAGPHLPSFIDRPAAGPSSSGTAPALLHRPSSSGTIQQWDLTCPPSSTIQQWDHTCPPSSTIQQWDRICPPSSTIQQRDRTCPPSLTIQQWDHTCPPSSTIQHLRDADRGRGKGRSLRLGMKDPPYCVTYVMLPRSCSSHNVLHSPSYHVITTQFSFKNTILNIL